MRHVNQIILIGRVSGEPEWRALPGGGEVAIWRLIVEHEGARSPQDAIDTIRCVSFDPAVQVGVRGIRHGNVVEVRGSLRHRFWRGPSGPRGVYEVEAATVTVHRRATPPEHDPPPAPRTAPARAADAETPARTTAEAALTAAEIGSETAPAETPTGPRGGSGRRPG